MNGLHDTKASKSTEMLAGMIGGDAATLSELLHDLIGAGHPAANTLAAAAAVAARIGAAADLLAEAHGGVGWRAGSNRWLFEGSAIEEAVSELEQQARSCKGHAA